MNSADIKVFGRERLVENLSSFKRDLVRRLTSEIEIIQALVSNYAKANHPYKDRTGNLTKSIQPGRVTIENTAITAEMRAGDLLAPYASFVEGGTSRSRPYPFLLPALLKHRTELVQRARAAINGARP